MAQKKEILAEIQQLLDLKELMQAYEEIAVTRMRKIRSSVLQNREFIQGLTNIYQEVKSSYRDELMHIMKQKNMQELSKLSVIKKNGKTISVFLSTNTGLYGDIVRRTFRVFMDYVRKNNTDVMIIGKFGRLMYTEENPQSKNYLYFDFPDNPATTDISQQIMMRLIEYQKIIVFYGQFQNVVTQKPAALDVYGNQPEVLLQKTSDKKYFFEPDLEKIMVFFETEIFSSIFEQTIFESNLAKYASRILTLDAATENVNDRLDKYEMQKRILKHRLMNKKQLDAIAGISLW